MWDKMNGSNGGNMMITEEDQKKVMAVSDALKIIIEWVIGHTYYRFYGFNNSIDEMESRFKDNHEIMTFTEAANLISSRISDGYLASTIKANMCMTEQESMEYQLRLLRESRPIKKNNLFQRIFNVYKQLTYKKF